MRHLSWNVVKDLPRQLSFSTKTRWWLILAQITCACISMTSLLTVFRKGELTYRAWLPYDCYSSMTVYYLTYAHQLISLTLGALINVASDTLVCGLLLHICCQIEILECRLNRLPDDRDILRDCVLQHDSIFVSVCQEHPLWRVLNEQTDTRPIRTLIEGFGKPRPLILDPQVVSLFSARKVNYYLTFAMFLDTRTDWTISSVRSSLCSS